MKLKNDQTLSIAVGSSARSKVWKNKKMLWSEFVERLSIPVVTAETMSEFMQASKIDRGRIKDVGGYVSGHLRKGQRSPRNVAFKQVLTLDIDFAHSDFWVDFQIQYDNAAVLHATHSHTEKDPRYRLLMPVDRELSPVEYEACARYVAGELGIELFDNTTFEVNRLMFWPSTPKDVEYYFELQDGEFLDADEILSNYVDFTDSSEWATARHVDERIKGLADKQETPTEKKGIVGAFCRTYGIEEAIAEFLSDVYVPAKEGRYTFCGGSTVAGVVVYDNTFTFSHHGTDPTGGKLCNSFDLVRLNKFGVLDENNSGAKSFKAMEEFARRDKKVNRTIASEKLTEARYSFSAIDDEDALEVTESDLDWAEQLETDSKGRYLSTSNNIDLILSNDKHLKGAFKFNTFANKKYVCYGLPWRKIDKPEPMRTVDFSGIRNYIEGVYGIASMQKIDDSLALVFERNSYHPIRDYLGSLTWDGQTRVDNILIDYFGTPDDIYHREAIRKMLVGAVARVTVPGIKFDLVLTLVGEQGTGKSTLVHKLGRGWSTDTFMTVHGKEAFEQLFGSWLVEMAELSGLRKAEAESIKHYISKQEDTFRPAFGRTTETYKRQQVFIGTTNNLDFLSDPTGNRRFMPVRITAERAKKSIFDMSDFEIDQIWAEAVCMFKAGEKLYLSEEANLLATEEQLQHSQVDERSGIVSEFLNTLLPDSWDELDVFSRQAYLDDPKDGTVQREFVCIPEIWCECLGLPKNQMDRYKTRAINDIMKTFPEWERTKSTKRFSGYGIQKYYKRVKV